VLVTVNPEQVTINFIRTNLQIEEVYQSDRGEVVYEYIIAD